MLLCMPRRTYFLKRLRLVHLTVANRLGIAAEAPTVLSPAVHEPRRCDRCPVTYTPLIYQPRPPHLDSKPGDLLPLCGPEELQELEGVAFRFRVRDGTLCYSIC
jgi:hypothetical protein